jgi:hypothetical protein
MIVDKRKIATLSLMAGMFFNPLGFDILFYSVNNLTNSYWITTSIFYLASASCFGLYWVLNKNKKD